jgi:hypothetical protein
MRHIGKKSHASKVAQKGKLFEQPMHISYFRHLAQGLVSLASEHIGAPVFDVRVTYWNLWELMGTYGLTIGQNSELVICSVVDRNP